MKRCPNCDAEMVALGELSAPGWFGYWCRTCDRVGVDEPTRFVDTDELLKEARARVKDAK